MNIFKCLLKYIVFFIGLWDLTPYDHDHNVDSRGADVLINDLSCEWSKTPEAGDLTSEGRNGVVVANRNAMAYVIGHFLPNFDLLG